MTPLQAIRAATVEAAALVGHEGEIGTLRVGAFADMIAVEGDPLADARVLESVAGVIKGGERFR
jgi:imidazolonepropionase-like amidohydrolase